MNALFISVSIQNLWIESYLWTQWFQHNSLSYTSGGLRIPVHPLLYSIRVCSSRNGIRLYCPLLVLILVFLRRMPPKDLRIAAIVMR